LALNIPEMNPIITDKTNSKILMPRFAIDIKAFDKEFDKSSIIHAFRKVYAI